MPEASRPLNRRTALQAGTVLAVSSLSLNLAGAPRSAAATAQTAQEVPAADLEQRALALTPPAFLFETGVPAQVRAGRGSTLSISDQAALCGRHSLRWEHSARSTVTVEAPLRFTPDAYVPGRLPGADQAWQGLVDTFSVWVHNASPVDDVLRFEFGRGGRTDAWFDFGLDFKGWRTAWVRYGYDMKGRPHPDMDTLRLVAPASAGVLHVDQLVLNVAMRPDQPVRDAQVPFVALESDEWDNAHWQALYQFDELLTRNRPQTPQPSATELEALRALVTRYRDEYLLPVGQAATTPKQVADLTAQVEAMGVPAPGSTGLGRPIVSYQHQAYPPEIAADLKTFVNAVTLRACTDLLKSVALAHGRAGAAERPALAALYVRMIAHLRDQGWACGSSQGTVHHLGYDARGLYDSVYLMRDVLREEGLLEAVRADMTWFTGLGRVFRDWQDRQAYGGIMDVFNTTVRGMLASVLLMDTEAEQVAYLHALRTWLDRALTPSNGIQDGLKPDGTSFHHIGFYPDYSRDGFTGLAPIVYVLSGGLFRISGEAHASYKKTLLTMRAYANTFNWPLPLSGRHPTGVTALSITPYQWAAISGTPDGTSDVDPELGAAFLRLLPAQPATAQRVIAQRLAARGITAETAPHGTWAANYAALSLHRRQDWLVAVRGHNRYHWSTEIYEGSNWYGRYSTYGQIQVLGRGNPVTNAASGFSQNGWDWARWPGTTAINVPLADLKADLTGTIEEMLLTDSAFAGGHTIDGRHGMFAMRLHEHPKYDASHRALKSVFLFDDRIIAVGTGIENTDRTHETETTLFQSALSDRTAATYVDAAPVTAFPYERPDLRLGSACWLLDGSGTGYYVPAGQRVGVRRATQQSRDQATDLPTSGDFATAWVGHGRAPRDAAYEYAMLVEATADSMTSFSRAMASQDTAPYRVLRADSVAHVVSDRATGITGYAVFEATRRLQAGPVREVDTPCLVLTRSDEEGGRVLSVCDPDLRLYEGKDREQYRGGTYTGAYTSYSRKWQANPSAEHRLTVVLDGRWRPSDSGQPCRTVSHGDTTRVQFTTVDGRPVQVRLVPVD
ncbi:chondroitinase family polysaccharide lyase [Streptomyces sp. NPDC060209]|uniref:chondroitinase family polysaccharide lyase n=1 Tax=Streptomyces sp. NPDC060209 TaxID=3347073 RepID=UPI00366A480B